MVINTNKFISYFTVTIFLIFLGARLAYGSPETLLKDSSSRLWVKDDIKKYPKLADEYLINQTIDSEFYIYPQKGIGYLRSFFPFERYKYDENLYFCVSTSNDDVISTLDGVEPSSRNDLHMNSKVYLIVLAESLKSCNTMYSEGKYLRLFGDFNPTSVGRFLKALDVATFNSKCNIAMKPDFLGDAAIKIDIEIKYKENDANIYADIFIITKNSVRLLNLISDETKAKIVSCDIPK